MCVVQLLQTADSVSADSGCCSWRLSQVVVRRASAFNGIAEIGTRWATWLLQRLRLLCSSSDRMHAWAWIRYVPRLCNRTVPSLAITIDSIVTA